MEILKQIYYKINLFKLYIVKDLLNKVIFYITSISNFDLYLLYIYHLIKSNTSKSCTYELNCKMCRYILATLGVNMHTHENKITYKSKYKNKINPITYCTK